MSDLCGCVGVVVDAKPQAVAFYKKFGFECLELADGQSREHETLTLMFLAVSEPSGLITVTSLWRRGNHADATAKN